LERPPLRRCQPPWPPPAPADPADDLLGAHPQQPGPPRTSTRASPTLPSARECTPRPPQAERAKQSNVAREEDEKRKLSKAAKLLGAAHGAALQDDVDGYTIVKLRIISGRELPKQGEQCCVAEVFDRYHPSSTFGRRPTSAGVICAPYVAAEVHGGGCFRCAVAAGHPFAIGATHTTAASAAGGLQPIWDERVDCVVERPDTALLSLQIYDGREGGKRELLCYEMLPMAAIRTGYRAVRLRSPGGARLQFGALLVHIEVEARVGGVGASAMGRPAALSKMESRAGPPGLSKITSRMSTATPQKPDRRSKMLRNNI
jgi:hypothetical protein